MEKKKINLLDLPKNFVYIKIEEPIRSQFLDYIIKRFGGIKKTALKLNLTKQHFYSWKKGSYFLKLEIMKRMLNSLNKEEKNKFYNLIQKNIESIKAGSHSTPINNLKFPIKFSSELVRIAGHLVGDGGISYSKEERFRTYYYNNSTRLVNEFKEDLFNIFGNVSLYEYEDKRYHTKGIKVPRIIGIILYAFFGFQANKLKHIPTRIIKSNKNYKSQFLRALFDDEGCIYTKGRNIQLEMKNKKIIEETKKLLKDLRIESSKMEEVKDSRPTCQMGYRYSITGFNNFKKFYEKIGFSHPQKAEKLKTLIKNYKFIIIKAPEFRDKIIDYLRKGRMNSFDLAKKLNKSRSTTKKHLIKLEKEGLIKSKTLKQNLKIYYI